MDQNPPENERRKSVEIQISVEQLFRQFLRQLGQELLERRITLDQFEEEGLSLLNIDRTTGTFNKEGIKIALETSMKIAQQNHIPLSILFIDGDNFKEINDEISHEAGDRAILGMLKGIQRASQRRLDIRTRLREGESVQEGRQGGDEFIIILLGTNLYGATRVAENVQRQISLSVTEIVPEYTQTFHHPFTASIGMAEFDPSIDKNAEDLLIRADQNLSLVRDQQGRNRRGQLF